jgi:hypothetical protein
MYDCFYFLNIYLPVHCLLWGTGILVWVVSRNAYLEYYHSPFLNSNDPGLDNLPFLESALLMCPDAAGE